MGKRSKDKRDIYYRLAKESGYRARSAYKLKQILAHFHSIDLLIEHRKNNPSIDQSINIVDLCAAPGGWSEVCYEILHQRGQSNDQSQTKPEIQSLEPPHQTNDSAVNQSDCVPINQYNDQVIAIDLAPIAPLVGIKRILGDITRPDTLAQIQTALQSNNQSNRVYADLVICDGAPDVTGAHDVDEFVQHALVMSALTIACCLLKPQSINQSNNQSNPPNNVFVAKVFRGKNISHLLSTCQRFFTRVTLAKPRACRNSSVESFVVCEGYAPPDGFIPRLDQPIDCLIDQSHHQSINASDDDGDDHIDVPFVSCGDELDLDADQSYPLTFSLSNNQSNNQSKYRHISPSAAPIAPPWARAAAITKSG